MERPNRSFLLFNSPNNTMANILSKGMVKVEPRLKAASVAIANGDLLVTASGFVTPATSSASSVIGSSLRTVVSTDFDYASNTEIGVIMPDDHQIFSMAVTGTTLSQANINVAYDLSDAHTVNLSGTSHKVVTCVGLTGSNTVGLFKINSRQSDINGA